MRALSRPARSAGFLRHVRALCGHAGPLDVAPPGGIGEGTFCGCGFMPRRRRHTKLGRVGKGGGGGWKRGMGLK